MKKILFTLLLCISSVLVFAQAHKKIIVYCTIATNGNIDYGDLKKLLPDSISNKLLVEPKKQYGIKKPGHTLLLMSSYGWKLTSVITDVSGVSFSSQYSNYVLSKEVYLDAAAYALYVNKLINIEKK
jgi:hypothetical protein